MSYYYNEVERKKPTKSKSRTLALVVTSLVLILLLVFASTQTMGALSTPPKKILVIGTNTPFQPFEYTNSNGNVVGFDMDLGNAIAAKLNRQVQVQDFQDFYALLPAVDAGNIDIGLSAITITSERSSVFKFSIPYYNSSQGVLVSSTSKLKCSTTCVPSNFIGFTVAYQSQTTSESWVVNNLIGKVQLKGNVSLTDFNTVTQYLKSGRVDAVIVDYPVALSLSNHDSTLKVAGNIPTGEQYGIAVKGGDPQHLLPTINQVIKQMIASGELKKLQDKWFSQ